ncbi:VOC family protein [Candidatus Nitrosocosmicus arcticus]|uniref:Glyoxalase/bleomycin resistance domain protein n=1 Tax=Candidatus Nitrosocosmicus arcticus TaxID=2035267 RepID=A0A557SWX6_9ARCH|nr:VOC family protein [Candidatus Nitrosocosmicus arcticus]TVP41102.1 glyoxalase/bleomycin resistance domain protein [Candidatus Nitrosocosmicus arcticus]
MSELNLFPSGYHSVNPYLVIGDVLEFIKFSKTVFNAVLVKQIKEENGTYAEVRIGDTCIMMEENHQISHLDSSSLWVYVRDADAIYDRALKAALNRLKHLKTSTQ